MKKRADAEFRQRVADALDASAQFFDFLARTLLSERPIVRLREAGAAEPLLGEPLAALERSLLKTADALEDGRERDELLEQRARLRAIRGGIDEWLGLSNEGHVYWVEKSGRKQAIVTLRSAPVDVAPELERCLFGVGVSVVCTSATLAVAGEMALSRPASAPPRPGPRSPSPPLISSATCASSWRPTSRRRPRTPACRSTP
jgi:ATP-dependent DNA helicase DinG